MGDKNRGIFKIINHNGKFDTQIFECFNSRDYISDRLFIFANSFDNLTIYKSLIVGEKGSKYGLYDHNFQEILPLQYDTISINEFEQMAEVKEDELIGIFDIKKRCFLLPIIYQEVHMSNEGIKVNNNNLWETFDYNGNLVSASGYSKLKNVAI